MPFRTSQMRCLILHIAFVQAGASLAGGFIGAYLLKSGFSLAAALVAYAAYLGLRNVARFASLALVRRIGFTRAMILGTAIIGLQYLPLIHADRLPWLAAWMLCVAVGESLYCPIYHAALATAGDSQTRGRQLGVQTAMATLISIAAPLAGAWLLTVAGPAANFGVATVLLALAVVPLLYLHEIPAGPVPAARATLAGLDPLAIAIFAADGWIGAGILFAWPMILFTALGASYGALGLSAAAAGVVGAAASAICGHVIDRGHRATTRNLVCLLLAASILLRAAATWSAWAAFIANLTAAAILALYIPVLMTTVYERAKRSGAAYRFHFALEAGWDAGAVAGCLTAALVARLCPATPSLAVLPAISGVFLMYAALRAASRDHAATPESLLLTPG